MILSTNQFTILPLPWGLLDIFHVKTSLRVDYASDVKIRRYFLLVRKFTMFQSYVTVQVYWVYLNNVRVKTSLNAMITW